MQFELEYFNNFNLKLKILQKEFVNLKSLTLLKIDWKLQPNTSKNNSSSLIGLGHFYVISIDFIVILILFIRIVQYDILFFCSTVEGY